MSVIIRLGMEISEAQTGVALKYNPHHYPKGPRGGQFAPKSLQGTPTWDSIITTPYRGTRVQQKLGFRDKLPELKGTDKQKAWAGEIRDRVLGRMRDQAEQSKKVYPDKKHIKDKVLAVQKLHNDLAKQTKAEFWIDNAKALGQTSDVHPMGTGSKEFSENMQKFREVLSNTARQAKESRKLPELSGSEKQVAWAERIRSAAIEATRKTFKPEYLDGTAKPMNEKQKQVMDTVQSAWKELHAQHSAKWWIDNRDTINDHVENAARKKAKEVGLG